MDKEKIKMDETVLTREELAVINQVFVSIGLNTTASDLANLAIDVHQVYGYRFTAINLEDLINSIVDKTWEVLSNE